MKSETKKFVSLWKNNAGASKTRLEKLPPALKKKKKHSPFNYVASVSCIISAGVFGG